MADVKRLSQLGSQELHQLEDISQWGLPSAIVDNYQEKGVTRMFPWQVQCLMSSGVLQGKNLVYSAPTSAGKTLVAELLMLKRVLETRKKAIMILPFVSVTREKMFYFQNLFSSGGLRVGGYMGSHFPVGGFQTVDIAVCTIEKANALVNKLLQENELDLLCCVVVDELHMLGEPQRGYLLELLLTKLLYDQRHSCSSSIQLIGMSATLPNLDLVAHWLDASIYRTEYRPVPLTECVKVGSAPPLNVITGQVAEVPVLRCALPRSVDDPDGCLGLVIRTVSQGFGVLMFLPTKTWCEKMSQQIARAFLAVGKPSSEPENVDPELLQLGADLRAINKRNELQEVLEKLRQTPAGLDENLKKTIPYGVAFHHAGLTYDERDIIENAFKAGVLNVLTATSTLSSGVNLPARRVLIRTPIFARQLLDVLTYKQMIGRAGRKGIDDRGESILICKDHEREQAMRLATMKLAPVQSCLASRGSVSSAFKRAILEVVASGMATTLSEVESYTKCTFLNECEQAALSQRVADEGRHENGYMACLAADACIEFLVKNDFIQVLPEESGVRAVTPTKLAQAVLASSLSPDQALLVLRELRKCRENFVLENDLHIIYEVTPYFISEQASIDYSVLSEFFDALSEDRRRVANLIGFDLGYVYKCIRGAASKRDKEMQEPLHRRFYVALALNELVQEVSLADVSAKFGLQKGMLQNLQQSAATFAGMMAIFCKRLGWHNLELLIAQFQKRLHFGVQQELCELLQLVPMTAQAARILFNAGFIALPELARAELHEVEAAFRSARVYQGKYVDFQEGESSADVRWIYLNGFDGVTEREAARLLIDQARKTLHDWLGVKVDFERKEQALSQQPLAKDHQQETNDGADNDTDQNAPLDTSTKQALVDGATEKANTLQRHQEAEPSQTACHRQSGTVQAIAELKLTETTTPSRSCTSHGSDLSATLKQSKTLTERSTNPVHHENDVRTGGQASTKTQLDGSATTSEKNNEKSRVSLNSSRIMGENSFHEGVEHCSTPTRNPTKDKREEVKQSTNLQTTSVASNTAHSAFHDYESLKRSKRYPSTEGVEDTSAAGQPSVQRSSIENAEEDSIFGEVKTQQRDQPQVPEKNGSMDMRDSSLFDDIDTQPDDTPTIQEHQPANIRSRRPSMAKRLTNANPAASVRVTPTKIRMLEEEGQKIQVALRASKKRCLEEECTNGEKKSKPNSSPSFDGDMKLERRSASEDSMAFFNSSQLKDITQNAKNALADRLPRVASENDSDLIFDCVLTCQRGLSNEAANGDDVLPQEVEASADAVDMVSTLTGPSKMQTNSVQDSDSDLFSDGENALPIAAAKEPIGDNFSEDESSLDLHLTSSSSSLTFIPSKDSSSLLETGGELRCVRELTEAELFRQIEAAGRRFSLSLETEPAESSVRIEPAILGSRTPSTANAGLSVGSRRLVGFCVAVKSDEGIFYTLRERDERNAMLLKKILEPSCVYTIAVLDCLNQLKTVMVTLGLVPDSENVRFEVEKIGIDLHMDAGIAHWLLDSSACSCPSLENLCQQYCPMLTDKVGKSRSTSVPRSCIESCLHLSILKAARHHLSTMSISQEVFRREMRICVVLARIDLNGFGYDDKTCEAQVNAMRDLQLQLESKMACRAQRAFKISSPTEVSRVIYTLFKDELVKLKIITGREPPGKLKLSSKAILVKLAEQDEFPQWIVDARKIASILAKDMFPVLRAKQFHSGLNQHRIYSTSSPYTATGRMASNEPNLQSMARNFRSAGEEILIRRGFVPMSGSVILSADFSQLEMRLLAHLSGDMRLCQMFSDPEGDVFAHVASQWRQRRLEDVSSRERQQAKELCYGIIYGKSVKSLAEDLAVTQEEGEIFLQSFHATFPGIQKYTSKVIANCRQLGYVETLLGRRRYLPNITSSNIHLKARAERQAINSTIQGSAADLLKSCLIGIDAELAKRFPESFKPHRSYGASTHVPIRGAFIVMQLHDEIILEVHESILSTVSQLVRFRMERAISLRVPLVVKLKTGPHWSSVTPFEAL
ncbi:DNA polymerase theta-like [Tropilaelaps mercedesae]|uniref:DNA-directed DNA polymerase n=1 Tax=Tropilaelaps mercedesae TaxID=418985 RepID=A0A1V9X7U1_9ACAR|nr:DNA polymerase theta-like [Tropilaelaps mercedesae]